MPGAAPALPAMRTPGEVIEVVRRALTDESHVLWAYLFGSVARHAAYRDVDVAIMPGPTMPGGLVAFGQLVAKLEAATAAKRRRRAR